MASKALLTKKNVRSPVWKYYGLQADEFGLPEDKGKSVCRVCFREVGCKDGSTSNMFMHLKAHHAPLYDECVKPIKKAQKQRANSDDASGDEEGASKESVVVVMKKGAKSAVWQYFGYRVNEQGKLRDREWPTCVLCKRDITARGGSTGNMRQHLRIHHPAEFNKVLEAKPGKNNQIQFSKLPNIKQDSGDHYASEVSKGVQPFQIYENLKKGSDKSVVWKYFGYPTKNEDCELDANKPSCLICQKQVATKKGDDSSLVTHLKENHIKEFSKVVSGAETKSSSSLLMKKNAKSPVWMFFGFQPNEDGQPKDKSSPMCILCKRTFSSKDGTTTSLMGHLKRAHPEEYGICKDVEHENKTRDEYVEIAQPSTSYTPTRYKDRRKGEEVTAPFLPDKTNPRSAVWKYFGFRTDISVHAAKSMPTCHLCKQDIKASGGTTNLWAHLKNVHGIEIKTTSLESAKPKKAVITDHDPSLDISTLLQKQNAKSRAWEFFGFRPHPEFTEKPLNPDIPTCRLCKKDVISKDTTTNLLCHLGSCHKEEFNRVRPKAVITDHDPSLDISTLLPKQNAKSPAWEYFGFRPHPDFMDKALNPDIPTCRLCKKDVISKDTTTNLLCHLRRCHREEFNRIHRLRPKAVITDHDPSLDISTLLPKQNAKSPAWEYFGFRPHPEFEEKALNPDIPTCRLCKKDVISKDTTTNLLCHLRSFHKEEFKKCVDGNGDRVVKDGRIVITDHDPSLDVSTLLPKQNAKSPTWEYFGFRPHPDFKDTALNLDIPTCRLCKKDVMTQNNTSNLHCHLKRYHKEEFKKCIEVKNLPQSFQRSSCTPFDDDNRACTSKSSAKSSIDNTSSPHNKPGNCHLCNKALNEDELINNCIDGEDSSKLHYCWDCFMDQQDDARDEGSDASDDYASSDDAQGDDGVCDDGLGDDELGDDGLGDDGQCDDGQGDGAQGDDAAAEQYDTIVFESVCEAFGGLASFNVKMESDTEKEDAPSSISVDMEEEDEENDDNDQTSPDNDTTSNSNSQANNDDDEMKMYMEEASKQNSSIKATLVTLDQKMGASMVLMFFAFPRIQRSDPEMPVCLLCKRPCPIAKEGDVSSLLFHLEKYHAVEHAMCQEMASGSSGQTFLMKKGRSPVWMYYGYYADQDGMPQDTNLPVCLLCKKSYVTRKGTTGSLIHHLEGAHPQELMIYKDMQSGVFEEEYMHCWSPIQEPSTPPVHLPASETDAPAANDVTASVSDPSSTKQPAVKEPFVCHRCKKSLTDDETINNEKAGAPTPEGETDHDYCWGCFAFLHDIGFTDDRYDTIHTGDERDKPTDTMEVAFENCYTASAEADISHEVKDYNMDTYERKTRHGVYKNGLYFCKFCNKSYHKRSSLQKHSKLHSLKERFLCSVCSKEFMWEQTLREHEQRHFGTLPYKCDICGKGFSAKARLERHETVHSKKKPFKCEICGKNFSDNSSLVVHKRRHTGDMPFECRMCGQRFISSSGRYKHMKNLH
ncbi:uncharacterized protein [Amphiura filiformis]|uniref:uncharacterized protein n=1 Tax=Amphiura filiformis TaxID=82378 RepID=UPI003B21182B